MLVTQYLIGESDTALCEPVDCGPPGSSVHFLGTNTGVGSHSLLPGDPPNPGIKPSLRTAGELFTIWATIYTTNYTSVKKRNCDFPVVQWSWVQPPKIITIKEINSCWVIVPALPLPHFQAQWHSLQCILFFLFPFLKSLLNLLQHCFCFLKNIIFNWSIVALQYFMAFCHTSA